MPEILAGWLVDENGSSVVLKFSNFHALLFYLRSFVETTISERDLDVNDFTFETITLNVMNECPPKVKMSSSFLCHRIRTDLET